MSEVRLSFHIMMFEQPNAWLVDKLMEEKEYDAWLKLVPLFRKREPDHHPCLRYEDIIAHLFMQIVGYAKNLKETTAISKTARQYANQAMKKICWNCRFAKGFGMSTEDDWTAAGLSMYSSKTFARNIRMNTVEKPTCHKNCCSCRVAKVIIFGNSFQDMVYWEGEGIISEYEDTAAKYAFKLMKIEKKYKKQRFISRKVIEAKKKLSAELNEMKAMFRRPMEKHKLDLSQFDLENIVGASGTMTLSIDPAKKNGHIEGMKGMCDQATPPPDKGAALKPENVIVEPDDTLITDRKKLLDFTLDELEGGRKEEE